MANYATHAVYMHTHIYNYTILHKIHSYKLCNAHAVYMHTHIYIFK